MEEKFTYYGNTQNQSAHTQVERGCSVWGGFLESAPHTAKEAGIRPVRRLDSSTY
jgi:hypothetical protein